MSFYGASLQDSQEKAASYSREDVKDIIKEKLQGIHEDINNIFAYRNTPHEPTGEKPSFLLFGIDLKSPTEASLLPPDTLNPTDLASYREKLVVSLSSARELAVASIREVQKSYKAQYDKKAKRVEYHIGDWVFVRFPEVESGKKRKMCPWYGPFRIVARRDPNLTVKKVYFPEDPSVTVHRLRVCPSPDMLPAGFYWYGAKRRSPSRTPPWLQRMLNTATSDSRVASSEETDSPVSAEDSQRPVDDLDLRGLLPVSGTANGDVDARKTTPSQVIEERAGSKNANEADIAERANSTTGGNGGDDQTRNRPRRLRLLKGQRV